MNFVSDTLNKQNLFYQSVSSFRFELFGEIIKSFQDVLRKIRTGKIVSKTLKVAQCVEKTLVSHGSVSPLALETSIMQFLH